MRTPEHNQKKVVCKNTRNSHKTLMYPLQKLLGPTPGRNRFCRAMIFWTIQMWRWHNIMFWFLRLCFSSLSHFLSSLLPPPLLFLHFLLHLKSFLLYIFFLLLFYLFILFICRHPPPPSSQYLLPHYFELGPYITRIPATKSTTACRPHGLPSNHICAKTPSGARG